MLEWHPAADLLDPRRTSVLCLLVFFSAENNLIHEAQMHTLHHPNIVRLIGVTFEPGHRGLIFKYVKYGGLNKFLQDFAVRFATV